MPQDTNTPQVHLAEGGNAAASDVQAVAPAPWKAVANSWQVTTVYDAKSMPVCRLDLEDWGVDEDNQADLERKQTAVARLIASAPSLRASHSELVKALDRVLQASERACAGTAVARWAGFENGLGQEVGADMDEALSVARAALDNALKVTQ